MKNKLDFKLINFALIAVIVFFIYQSSGLWIGFLNKALKIVLPLLAGFAIAYALNPFLTFLTKHKIPKGIAIFIVIAIIIGIIGTVIILLVPMLANQIVSLIDSLIIFVKNVTTNYNIDLGAIGDNLMKSLNQIISSVGKYVSDGAVKTINTSISVITTSIIALASSVYFLLDMDKIRLSIKKFLMNKSILGFKYVGTLDHEIRNYIKGFLQLVVINFFEYTIAFYIIGHPNALLLGFLSGLANFIPYFGGTIIQVIAGVTAFVISPMLCLKVVIVALIFSLIDTYILNPLIYGKSNQIHPLVVITAVFAGGVLFGFIGIIIAIPLAIIIINSYKFYRDNIKKKKIK
ncbi:MAG: AI-2E family transporter [Bacilli bacterium]